MKKKIKKMIARYYSLPVVVAVEKLWEEELAAMSPEERLFWEKSYDFVRQALMYGRLPTPEDINQETK